MSTTASMSLKTVSSSPETSAPLLRTKSIWVAPCSSAFDASNALTLSSWPPCGKPTTVPRVTRDRPIVRFAAFTSHGLTVRAASSCSVASPTAAARSARDALGCVRRCSTRSGRRPVKVIGARSLRSGWRWMMTIRTGVRTADCSSVPFGVSQSALARGAIRGAHRHRRRAMVEQDVAPVLGRIVEHDLGEPIEDARRSPAPATCPARAGGRGRRSPAGDRPAAPAPPPPARRSAPRARPGSRRRPARPRRPRCRRGAGRTGGRDRRRRGDG